MGYLYLFLAIVPLGFLVGLVGGGFLRRYGDDLQRATDRTRTWLDRIPWRPILAVLALASLGLNLWQFQRMRADLAAQRQANANQVGYALAELQSLSIMLTDPKTDLNDLRTRTTLVFVMERTRTLVAHLGATRTRGEPAVRAQAEDLLQGLDTVSLGGLQNYVIVPAAGQGGSISADNQQRLRTFGEHVRDANLPYGVWQDQPEQWRALADALRRLLQAEGVRFSDSAHP